MQQTFIEMRACDAHLIGQLEAAFKITRRNALIEKIGVLAVFFFGLARAAHGQGAAALFNIQLIFAKPATAIVRR